VAPFRPTLPLVSVRGEFPQIENRIPSRRLFLPEVLFGPPNQLPLISECKAKASELRRVAAVSARDMNATGHAAPHSTPPNRQAAVYMMAFTVKFAESKLGKSMMSATPKSEGRRE
jgi:hypothetical protein